ncbi:MAG: hypothetical protein U0T84_10415 [Chitinophagales bacterium]
MKYFGIFVCCAFVLFTSCKKSTQEEQAQSAKDNAQMESEYAQIYDAVSNYAAYNPKIGKKESAEDYILPNGAIVAFQDSIFDGNGIAFTIDYGPLGTGFNKGIPCKDGRYRAGKIKISLDQRWNTTPSVMTVTIDPGQYYSGNGTTMYEVSGQKTIRHTAPNSYDVQVSNGRLVKAEGTVSWSTSRTITQIVDVPGTAWGDVFTYSGTSTGTNVKGETFTVSTIQPLKKRIEAGCLTTFVSGKLEVSSGSKSYSVNFDPYSNEACDRKAVVTYNGKDYFIDVW